MGDSELSEQTDPPSQIEERPSLKRERDPSEIVETQGDVKKIEVVKSDEKILPWEPGYEFTLEKETTKPDVDKTRPLRAGKWTAEEEEFTRQVVLKFDNGELSDCPDGTTLRSYLAQRLNCNPMRISKKLAGLKLGKVICFFNLQHSHQHFLMTFKTFTSTFLESHEAEFDG